MSNVPIRDMTQTGTPDAASQIVFDNGVMRRGTVASMADAVRPVASLSEAEAGSDNAKTMTSLRVKNSIASEVGVSLASKAQGDLANTAVQAGSAGSITSAMLNSNVFSTPHTWGGPQSFAAPILGVPASVTLTNATGLPIATGVADLGAGIATFLTTPSSANLRAALTDETGTGSAVFASSPNITTPTGIVKGDVGLGNVDNTSDSTKWAATKTLTNTTYDTAGTGNAFSINGVLANANTGTGAVVRATGSTISGVALTGTADIQQALSLSGDISPAQITANTIDYAPTGFSTSSTVRVSTDASRNISGLAGGADGRLVVIHNVGSFPAVLTNEDATSTAANRFKFGGNITLAADTSITVRYDATSSRWRAITSPGSGGGGGVTSVTVGGTTISTSGTLPAVAYDAAQSLTIPQLAIAQTNIGLPSVLRRPMEAWLPKWGAARANVLAGISNAKLLCIGDSTFGGSGATVGNVNVAPYTFPAQLAQQLTSLGLNSSWQSRWSDNNWVAAGPGLATTDSRVVMGAYSGSTFNTLGGVLLTAGGTGSPFKFTPTTSVDTFDFYYITNTGQGTLNLDINGGTPTSINLNSSPNLSKATKTGSLGASTLNITPTSAGNTYFTGVIAYNSAVKEVSVINAGFGAGDSGTFNDSAYFFSTLGAPTGFLGFLAPDLTIIDLTINDALHGTALSTYQTNMQAIITKAKVSGDVILLGGVPAAPGAIALATQIAVNNMAAALAAKNSVNYISMFDLWGSQAAMAAAGYSADTIHPNAAGYAAQAALIAPMLQ